LSRTETLLIAGVAMLDLVTPACLCLLALLWRRDRAPIDQPARLAFLDSANQGRDHLLQALVRWVVRRDPEDTSAELRRVAEDLDIELYG